MASRTTAFLVFIGLTLFSFLPYVAAEENTPPTNTAADLAIFSPPPISAIPGETTVYTLTIRNQGPNEATNIVLTHVFANGEKSVWVQPAQPWCDRRERSTSCTIGEVRPNDTTSITLDLSVGGTQTHATNTQDAGVTLDLSTPTCAIDSPQVVTCRLAKLAPGAASQIRIAANVDAYITGTLVSSASVTANEFDPNLSNNRATITMTVDASARVSVAPANIDLAVQADGPTSVIAGQSFTYTYTILNRGELDATGVHFQDALPSTANFYSVVPGLPKCDQRGDAATCTFFDPDRGETIAFTLAITGTTGQPVRITPDVVMPGLPICTLLQERTWLHIVNCELGKLKRGKSTQVQLGFVAIGLQENVMTNGAFVRARETDLNALDNAITSTIAVSVRSDLSIRSALSGPASAGKPLSYTLTIANNGPSDADRIVLTDTLPINTRLLSTILNQGEDCRLEQKDAATDVVICRLKPMRGGTTTTMMIILAVDGPVSKSMVHSAMVISDQVDPDLSNNELTESIPVTD